MTHIRCNESLMPGSAGPEKNGKCVFIYVVVDKDYERLMSLNMASTSPCYSLVFHRSQKYVSC